jgi:hypothetical protein
MRQEVQLQAARNAPHQRSNDPTPSEYVRHARYAGRRRKGGLLHHGIEVLLWAAAGSGAIGLALSTNDIPWLSAAVSPSQAVENVRWDRPETSSSHALKHLDSRAKAELSSKMRIARLGANSGNPSVSALVEWTKWLDVSSVAAAAADRRPSPRPQEKSADHRPVPVDHIPLDPTTTGSIWASETSSTQDR